MEKKAHRGKMWKIVGIQYAIRGMWEYFTLKRAEAMKILEDAARERQAGIQGQWQQESLFRVILKQVRGNVDMGCGHQMMRKGYIAMRDGSWEELKERYREVERSSEWTLERIREVYEKVARDAVERLGIVQEIFRKSTDFLLRIILRQSVEWEESRCRISICPHCNSFPLEDHIRWVSTGHGDSNNGKKKHCSWWCAACGGQYEWRAPNRILVVQLGTSATEAKEFKAHAVPEGLCDDLINALKRLGNQQTDGDCPMQNTVTGLQERSRERVRNGLRSFIELDNHGALDVGHLRQCLRPFTVKKTKLSEDHPEVLREGADDLTLRVEEVDILQACINVDHMGE